LPKKILVIDDSALMRRVISDIINESNDYEVCDIARDGLDGFEKIMANPSLYNAVILDINMPKMNGLELLERLHQCKIEQNVIVVSTVAKQGTKETIKALELGAFDFVTKPENYLETKGEAFKKKILSMLDVSTSYKAVRRPVIEQSNPHLAKPLTLETSTEPTTKVKGWTNPFEMSNGGKRIVALACSTGGPKSLQQVIPLLPKNLNAGIVIVQHMPPGFTASLAQRLDEISEVHVKEAEEGDVISKGTVYIAPGGKHMCVVKEGAQYCIRINTQPPIEGLRPCANMMYESLLDSNFDEITCVVLTGMGADGTDGIKKLAENHKRIHVIAQNEETCVVYGMPKAIIQTGLVDEVLPLNQIAEQITKNVGVS
jgi:two-component system chemotaxis response regulator CheB